MEIIEYDFNSVNPITKKRIDDTNFKNLSSKVSKEVLKNKDKILSSINSPVCDSFKDLEYINKISICENGIKINLSYENINSKNDAYEEARIYIFEDGKILYVPTAIVNDGILVKRKDFVISNLEERIGKIYLLKKERTGILEKVLKTKEYNERLTKLCKSKCALILSKSIELSKNKELIMKISID